MRFSERTTPCETKRRPCIKGMPALTFQIMAALMGASTVSVLRLPLSSIIIALVVSQAGLATGPLIIVAVVVAYIATLDAFARSRSNVYRDDRCSRRRRVTGLRAVHHEIRALTFGQRTRRRRARRVRQNRTIHLN